MTTVLAIGSIGQLAQADGRSLAEHALSADAIILVDTSGSMSDTDAPGGISRHDAAEEQLRTLQQDMPGKLVVVSFSNEVRVSPSGVPERMDMGTQMAKALQFVHPVEQYVKVILISDGDPFDRQKTLDQAARFTAPIDTVYVGPEHGSGRKFLQRLADTTGGTYYKSKEPGMLAASVRLLLTEKAGEVNVISL